MRFAGDRHKRHHHVDLHCAKPLSPRIEKGTPLRYSRQTKRPTAAGKRKPMFESSA
jgi:hypothetical protein